MGRSFEVVYNQAGVFEKQNLPEVETLQENQVLVKPHYVGICGSDLFLIQSGLKNLRLGHEWVGEVLATGVKAAHFKVGSLVTGTGHFACGECEYCLDKKTNLCNRSLHFSSDKMGALRSTFTAPAHQIFQLTAAMNSSLALIEIFAVGEQAWHLIQGALQNHKNPKVLVFGAGPIGLATACVLQSYGVDFTLIEKVPSRIENAKKLQFKTVSSAEAMLDPTFKNQFNLLIDCTNDYSGDQGAFRWLNHFSQKEYTALIVGKYVTPQTVAPTFNSKSAQLIWMRGVSSFILETAITRWQDKLNELKPCFVSHEFAIEDVTKAFAAAENKTESMKVLIKI